MPVVNASTLETNLPGATRRRIWAHPEVTSHSLVVLTFDRLYAAPLPGTPKPEVVSALEDGGNIDDALGPLAVAVELATVRDVKLDLLTNSLVVEHVRGAANASRLTVTFASPEAADACFTKIWRRLGDGFQLQPYKRDAWAASRSPIVLLVGALLVTALLALVLSVFEDMASVRAAQAAAADGEVAAGARPLPKQPLEVLLGWMDWRWVCAAGGAVAALAQVWLYRRLTRPPTRLELKRV